MPPPINQPGLRHFGHLARQFAGQLPEEHLKTLGGAGRVAEWSERELAPQEVREILNAATIRHLSAPGALTRARARHFLVEAHEMLGQKVPRLNEALDGYKDVAIATILAANVTEDRSEVLIDLVDAMVELIMIRVESGGLSLDDIRSLVDFAALAVADNDQVQTIFTNLGGAVKNNILTPNNQHPTVKKNVLTAWTKIKLLFEKLRTTENKPLLVRPKPRPEPAPEKVAEPKRAPLAKIKTSDDLHAIQKYIVEMLADDRYKFSEEEFNMLVAAFDDTPSPAIRARFLTAVFEDTKSLQTDLLKAGALNAAQLTQVTQFFRALTGLCLGLGPDALAASQHAPVFTEASYLVPARIAPSSETTYLASEMPLPFVTDEEVSANKINQFTIERVAKTLVHDYLEHTGFLDFDDGIDKAHIVVGGQAIKLNRVYRAVTPSYTESEGNLLGRLDIQIETITPTDERYVQALARLISGQFPWARFTDSSGLDCALAALVSPTRHYKDPENSRLVFKFAHYDPYTLSERQKCKIMRLVQAGWEGKSHADNSEDLTAFFTADGHIKQTKINLLSTSEKIKRLKAIFELQKEQPVALPSRTVEVFEAIIGPLVMTDEGNDFVTDFLNQPATRDEKFLPLLRIVAGLGVRSDAIQAQEKHVLRDQFLTPDRAYATYFTATVELRKFDSKLAKLEFFDIVDRLLERRFGRYYPLHPRQILHFLRSYLSHCRIKKESRYLTPKSYSLHEFIERPTDITDFSFRDVVHEFCATVAERREGYDSSIQTERNLHNGQAIDEMFERILVAKGVSANPATFISLLFPFDPSQRQIELDLGQGKKFYTTLSKLIDCGNASMGKNGAAHRLPLAPEFFNGEVGFIPFDIRNSPEKTDHVRKKLLAEWVMKNGITLEMIQAKLSSFRLPTTGTAEVYDVLACINSFNPRVQKTSVIVDGKSVTCYYRVADLFYACGLHGPRSFWLVTDISLLKAIGLMGEAAKSERLIVTGDVPVASIVNDAAFIEAIGEAIEKRSGGSEVDREDMLRFFAGEKIRVKKSQVLDSIGDEGLKQHLRDNPHVKDLLLDSKDVLQRLKRIFGDAQKNSAGVEHGPATDDGESGAHELITSEFVDFIKRRVINADKIDLGDPDKIEEMVQRYGLEPLLEFADGSIAVLKQILKIYYKPLIRANDLVPLILALKDYHRHKKFERADEPLKPLAKGLLFLTWANDNPQGINENYDLHHKNMLAVMFTIFSLAIENDLPAIETALRDFQTHTTPTVNKLIEDFFTETQLYKSQALPQTMMRALEKLREKKGRVVKPKEYQLHGIYRLTRPDKPNMLLADDPGMGKTLQVIAAMEIHAEAVMAAEKRKTRNVWVTPNANRQEIYNQLTNYTDNPKDDIVVISGRKDQIRQSLKKALTAKHVIVSFETLAKLEEKAPDLYEKLFGKELDCLALDETQFVDKLRSQRGRAAHKLKAQRKILLSGSPYEHHFENLWNIFTLLDPENFNERTRPDLFGRLFNGGQNGMIEAYEILDGFMVRRLKEDCYATVDPTRPLAEQPNTLPRRDFIPFQEAGGFLLTREQMIAYIETLIKAGGGGMGSSLVKLQQLFQSMLRPAGDNPINPALVETRRLVKEHLKNGDKIIIWSFFDHSRNDLAAMLDVLALELKAEGVAGFENGFSYARFDGSKTATATIEPSEFDSSIMRRDYDLHRFQFQDEPRVMLAGYTVGNAGVNMSRGRVSIGYEISNTLAPFIQAPNRNHRVDGLFPRPDQPYYSVVGQFPPDLIDLIADPRLREHLSKGTAQEILLHRMASFMMQYDLLMAGLVKEDKLTRDAEAKTRSDIAINFKVNVAVTSGEIFTTDRHARRAARVTEEIDNALELDPADFAFKYIVPKGETEPVSMTELAQYMYELCPDENLYRAIERLSLFNDKGQIAHSQIIRLLATVLRRQKSPDAGELPTYPDTPFFSRHAALGLTVWSMVATGELSPAVITALEGVELDAGQERRVVKNILTLLDQKIDHKYLFKILENLLTPVAGAATEQFVARTDLVKTLLTTEISSPAMILTTLTRRLSAGVELKILTKAVSRILDRYMPGLGNKFAALMPESNLGFFADVINHDQGLRLANAASLRAIARAIDRHPTLAKARDYYARLLNYGTVDDKAARALRQTKDAFSIPLPKENITVKTDQRHYKTFVAGRKLLRDWISAVIQALLKSFGAHDAWLFRKLTLMDDAERRSQFIGDMRALRNQFDDDSFELPAPERAIAYNRFGFMLDNPDAKAKFCEVVDRLEPFITILTLASGEKWTAESLPSLIEESTVHIAARDGRELGQGYKDIAAKLQDHIDEHTQRVFAEVEFTVEETQNLDERSGVYLSGDDTPVNAMDCLSGFFDQTQKIIKISGKKSTAYVRLRLASDYLGVNYILVDKAWGLTGSATLALLDYLKKVSAASKIPFATTGIDIKTKGTIRLHHVDAISLTPERGKLTAEALQLVTASLHGRRQ